MLEPVNVDNQSRVGHRLWDMAAGANCASLCTHATTLPALAFSPDSAMLASASADQTVCLWEPGNGGVVCVLRGHKGAVACVAFSPDGRRILSRCEDKTVCLWEVKTGHLLGSHKRHEHGVSAVTFSSDDQQVVSYSGLALDTNFLLWNTPRCVRMAQLATTGNITRMEALDHITAQVCVRECGSYREMLHATDPEAT